MAKRKLTSLRSVLLRYLLLCGGGCALILVLWWGIFMQLINIGFLLPAVASAQACAEARETVASMTADTFDSLQISDLCRWAVVQNDAVLQTNMDDRHLKIALNAFHGGSGNLVLMQYQYDVKMADGSFCLLQYDYALPYADPALRDTLPDFQTCYILLLAVLILVWLGWQTHCTVRAFAAETARLNAAVDAIAARQLEQIDTDGVRIREFAATLQALQTMGRELTDSLQSQWRMEQQRTEQIAALAHDLKTPLTVIQGNADLLAEDALSADQQTQVEAILRGTERARHYLAALRTAGAAPAVQTSLASHALTERLAQTARALCAPAGIQFILQEEWQGTIRAAENDLLRAAENLLDNAAGPHSARRNRHPDRCKGKQPLYFARDRYRPRLYRRSTGPGGGDVLHRCRAQRQCPSGLGTVFCTQDRCSPWRYPAGIQHTRRLRRALPAHL